MGKDVICLPAWGVQTLSESAASFMTTSFSITFFLLLFGEEQMRRKRHLWALCWYLERQESQPVITEDRRIGGAAAWDSPVRGRWASLGLAAEHHLPVGLHRLHRVHDAAWLLGESGTLQDAALCGTTRKHNTVDHEPAWRPVCKTAN